MKYLSLIVGLLFLVGCNPDAEDKTRTAIDKAQAYLSSNKCQEAIDTLEKSGLETTDAIYVQVYSSAYACRAGFSELTFFLDDISVINSSSSTALYKSLTQLSTSTETTADSQSYSDLLRAINITLNADGASSPSQVSRNNTYGSRRAADIGTQGLYMLIAQLGKYLYHYGNVSSLGVKGGGSAGSECFVKYDDPVAMTAVNALPGSNACDTSDNGHPDLSLSAGSLTITKRRMCEGLMIITNLADILSNVTLSTNDSLGDLTEVKNIVNDYVEDFQSSADADYAALIRITKQSDCESYISNSAKFAKLQQMYVALFEANLE